MEKVCVLQHYVSQNRIQTKYYSLWPKQINKWWKYTQSSRMTKHIMKLYKLT
jgi:hypothetical protein